MVISLSTLFLSVLAQDASDAALREAVVRNVERSDTGWMLAAALVLAGLCLAAWGAGDLVRRDRRSRGPTHRLLCRELGISAKQWRALRTLARDAGMSEPAALLVSRGAFDSACRRAPGVARDPHLRAIRRRFEATETDQARDARDVALVA